MPARQIRQGADTGMLAILLGSKNSRRRLGRTDASSFSLPAPKTLSGPPVEMLLGTSMSMMNFREIFFLISNTP
jgi:hypothetical protein